MRFLIILAVNLLLGLLEPAAAQTPGSLDVSFGSDSAINGDVLSIIPAGDGKVYIGGEFTMVRGVTRNRIARLYADGSLDTAFNPGTGADNWVSSVAIQQDGKVLIGGGFTGVNGTARNRIARLNSDGSLDPSFNPRSGANNSVHSVAIQQDGKVLIGGDFLLMTGTVRSRIARLNADGSLDATFDPGTGADKHVIALTVQGDGKVIVVGSFTRVNGTGRNRVARLNANGSLDTDFNPGSGADATVISAAIQGDGRVLIGGGVHQRQWDRAKWCRSAECRREPRRRLQPPPRSEQRDQCRGGATGREGAHRRFLLRCERDAALRHRAAELRRQPRRRLRPRNGG